MPVIPDAESLRESLIGGLSGPSRIVLQHLIAAAEAPLYAVGGTARDLLRRAPLVDIDLAIERDAIEFVRSAMPEVRVTTHSRFRTASLRTEDRRIDIVTARSETYARPGALPKVSPNSIEADLRRRDFSVNAMALRLNGTAALIDPCGGAADLEARMIRVLHDGSFRDDATRIFRAYRYATRLRFDVEPDTRALISGGTSYVPTIGGERLRRELELMLGEGTAGEALQAAANAGALSAINPGLAWNARTSTALSDGDRHRVSRVAFGFALLASGASPDEAAALVTRLRLKRDEAAAVRGIAALRATAHLLRRPNVKPSGVVMLLDRYPPAAVAAFSAVSDDEIAASLALRYLDEWRAIAPALRGDDLIAMGVPEGPQVHQGLQLIRASKLDGTIRDLADERVLALRFAHSIKDSRAMNAGVELHLNGD